MSAAGAMRKRRSERQALKKTSGRATQSNLSRALRRERAMKLMELQR
jgi:hypothetical protein